MVELAFKSEADLSNQAVALLNRHGLLAIPVNPIEVAEAEGIEVYSANLDGDVSGILRQERGVYCIYFNRNHVLNRQRFTVAHEIAHYVLHREQTEEFVDPELNLFRDDTSTTGSSRMEVQANIFAACLLMPEPLVSQQLEKPNCSIEDLAEMFGVSRNAIGHRLAGMLQG